MDVQRLVIIGNLNQNTPVFGRELKGVGQQIDQDLFYFISVEISFFDLFGERCFKLDIFSFREAFKGINDRSDILDKVGPFHFHLHFTTFQFGKVEHLVDPAGGAHQVYVECKAELIDEVEEKKRIWELFKSQPEPYGYDPALFFPAGPEDAEIGILKLTPWRLEVFSLAAAMSGGPKVWRQDV